jgi:hypothetical protein
MGDISPLPSPFEKGGQRGIFSEDSFFSLPLPSREREIMEGPS